MDEIIDRFGDPPPSVNSLVRVALLRGEAGKAGVTDIAQKNGQLRFRLDEFDMEIVSALYAMPDYKGRLRVDGGSVPAVLLKLKTRTKVIEQARAFLHDWQNIKEQIETKRQTIKETES